MSNRSFEGYSYRDPLAAGFYGHTYRAQGPSGTEARLLEVGDAFSAHQEFAAILLARGKLLTSFDHPHVVGTRAVGRAPDGHLLVVTDAVDEPSSLEEVLGGATDADMHPLPRPIATAVIAAVVDALAAAHQRSVVHGALHPRSVVIDRHGTVKLDDLAVGRALTSWSGRDSASAFVQAFAGFLAPEMAQGGRPNAGTDVYAAGALLLAAVTGRTAASSFDPGALSPAVAGVVARALDTNRLHRYANAKRLLDDLSAAWKADGWKRATREEIGAYLVQQQSHTEAALERETETVLSFLGDMLTPPPAAPELDAAMEAMLAELDDDQSAPAADAGAGAARASAPAMQVPAARLATEISADRASQPAMQMPAARLATEISADRASQPTMQMPAERLATEISADRSSAPDIPAGAGPDAGADTTPAPASRTARASSEAAALAALADLDQPDDDATMRVETVLQPERAPSAGDDPDQPDDDDTAPVETVLRSARADSEITDVLALEDVEVLDDADAAAATGASEADQDAAPASEPARAAPEAPAPGAPGGLDGLALVHERPTELMPSMRDRAMALPMQRMPVAGAQMPDLAAQPRRRRMPPALWIVAVLVAVVMLILVLRHQGFLRDQLEQRAEEREAEEREQLREYMADQPSSGIITIESEPPEAAVWMLLGRTPLDTTKLSASMVHELRLELEGHQPQDLRVTGEHWTGEGEELRAAITGRLAPGTPDEPLPAYPPEPPPEALQGLPEGQGVIHVESAPAGAQVWLLVGITPGVEVTATAGAGYELKVRKDGYLPGVVVVRPPDWEAGGQQVTRSITLQRSARKRRR